MDGQVDAGHWDKNLGKISKQEAGSGPQLSGLNNTDKQHRQTSQTQKSGQTKQTLHTRQLRISKQS